jgi:SsrA-binding protein
VKILAQNRRARHDFLIEKDLEAGLELLGSEVKAIRIGRMQIQDAYVQFKDDEAWLMGSHIGEYPHSRAFPHEAIRPRKLLLGVEEIRKWHRRVREKGYTIVPLEIYVSERGWIKIKLGLGKGKGRLDKRDDLKKKQMDRDMKRALKE